MKKANKSYRCELEITENGYYLTVEATINTKDERRLTADGWRFLNNGVTLDADGSPALYYWKPSNK